MLEIASGQTSPASRIPASVLFAPILLPANLRLLKVNKPCCRAFKLRLKKIRRSGIGTNTEEKKKQFVVNGEKENDKKVLWDSSR
jgi:hypothetical protein